MKQHRKTYEDTFSIDHQKSKTRLNLDEIKVGEMELAKYTLLFKNFLTDFYSVLFDNCVKLSWLRRKFSYYGKKTTMPMQNNPLLLSLAFVKYLRRIVGKDIQIITRAKFLSKIETYFDELFPGFEEGDPFTNPKYYKFPFKNISMEYMVIVYQLKDRVKLLRIADEKKMSYAVFMDYIINHVYSENDDLGRERYQVKHNCDKHVPFYIRDTDNLFKNKKHV